MKHYELIVFDWDGTLMDSSARIVECMQRGFHDNNLSIPDTEAISHLIGLGLNEVVSALAPSSSSTQLQAIADAYRAHFFTNNDTPSQLFEGVVQTLQHLKAEGFQLAIATGKSRRGLDKELDDTGIRDMFDVSRCADEARSKPHPDMLEEIMDVMGIVAGQTLMIGDTDYDMLMAGNAGADALAVSYGVHDKTRLLKTEPVGVVDAVTHIPAWLAHSKNVYIH